MARRNQNTFLKRQKEMERVRRAREKMSRRHGRKGKGRSPDATPEEASPEGVPAGSPVGPPEAQPANAEDAAAGATPVR